MYEEFYGFRTRPFSILPDADFLYLSKGHRFALSLLEYGLGSQTGFTVITGEIGSGKTTLVQYLLKNFAADHTIGHITNTAELNNDLLKWLLHAFGVRYDAESNVDLYQRLVDFIAQQYQAGHDCVLIIDEAQHLKAETLESLRLLSNINSGKNHLLKILLVGQPELSETLARPDLIQFAQRISTSFHLKPLTLLETREYVRNRLRIAGGHESLFDSVAADFIHLISSGVPRQINILCDTALVYAFADGKRRVELPTIINVLRDRASGQRSNEPGLLGSLDRQSIEKMIKEAREKEFTRESEEGISEQEDLLASPSAPTRHEIDEGGIANVNARVPRNPDVTQNLPADAGLLGAPTSHSGESHLFKRPSERMEASLRVPSGSSMHNEINPSRRSLPTSRPFQIYPIQESSSAGQQNVPAEGTVAAREPSRASWSQLKRFALLGASVLVVIGIVLLFASGAARSSEPNFVGGEMGTCGTVNCGACSETPVCVPQADRTGISK